MMVVGVLFFVGAFVAMSLSVFVASKASPSVKLPWIKQPADEPRRSYLFRMLALLLAVAGSFTLSPEIGTLAVVFLALSLLIPILVGIGLHNALVARKG
ncbi:hypothetical protein [Lysinibacter cavernae]|uniref:Uncharacterized protein n=1 Tax=Lysinibacter cavernae TaxID=1640652 RepID=A0A7X5TUG2_9MICO|nr:hypothetical protein [Lysinibacter cavernae]NIH52135.1 hypothetical protein [Lysinibacter cavernae]NIH55270.1 hypothetical protein [Lysinibacter cavernae]